MSSPFINVRFIAAEEPVNESPPDVAPLVDYSVFDSDEEAARFFIGRVLETDERAAVRGLAPAGDGSTVGEGAHLRAVMDSRLTETTLMRFEQTNGKIPVFGSHLNVELDRERNLVGLDGALAKVRGVSATPTLAAADALAAIARLTEKDAAELTSVAAPELNFYHDDEHGRWHLAYFFRDVPAAPPRSGSAGCGHGLGLSPRDLRPLHDYLVDAHTGTILFHYSATPTVGPLDPHTAAALLAVPVECRGIDELGAQHTFYGLPVAGAFELHDPLRRVKTFDLGAQDLEDAVVPPDPIRSASADLAETHRGAVSAHVNGCRVQDFYRSVLMRNSIDDRGMVLVSLVNCTYQRHQPPPEWRNAVWWNGRMWYGQTRDGAGRLKSLSAYLDVIAHELTHGITKYTSDLVYKQQSGALNESFSDIMGVIIQNWYTVGSADVAGWDWEIGKGLGKNGLPLRDFRDPTRTGDPDHMDDYLETTADEGGVHTNSNIHNKAAYNVLTATDDAGRVFTPRQVAVLYYLCLVRLPRLATFAQTLRTLRDVATVAYSGDRADQTRKVHALVAAYASVGITLPPE